MKKIWIALIGERNRFFKTPNGPRTMTAWVKSLNHSFQRYSSSKTEIVGWFGSNGNFVVNSAITNNNEIVDFFCDSTGYKAVLLNLSHIYWLIQEICSISYFPNRKDSLWDKGAGFQLKGTKRYFDEFSVDQNRIWCIERGVVGVNRFTLSTDLSKSEQKTHPKWIKISKGLETQLGGEWTTRSLPMLNGVFESALLFLSQK